MSYITIHNGDGMMIERFDGVAPDSNGLMVSDDLPHGQIFLAIDGVEYGSIALNQVIPGQFHIELGQYDPTFDQWAPQNPITDREKD